MSKNNDAILRLPEVKKLSGLSRTSIYRQMKQGTFPKQVHIGIRSVGWRAKDVTSWLETRTAM